jgi:hypothetical protein
LLLQVSRRILGIGGADPGADNRARCCTDAGATATAHGSTERCPKTSTEKRAAKGLGIEPVA